MNIYNFIKLGEDIHSTQAISCMIVFIQRERILQSNACGDILH